MRQEPRITFADLVTGMVVFMLIAWALARCFGENSQPFLISQSGRNSGAQGAVSAADQTAEERAAWNWTAAGLRGPHARSGEGKSK